MVHFLNKMSSKHVIAEIFAGPNNGKDLFFCSCVILLCGLQGLTSVRDNSNGACLVALSDDGIQGEITGIHDKDKDVFGCKAREL